MACRFANIRRFEDTEHKAVYLARISREPGYMSWSVDCEGKTAVLHIYSYKVEFFVSNLRWKGIF